ncbi:MAG: MBL fold metallo-hydrolase [Halobacteria archaeon]|nr:MBL fold metallo-hydrolase [Halobacteria archaeon]
MSESSCREKGKSDLSAEVHRMEMPVNWPPGHVAMYLIDAEETVLVDAGVPGDDERELLDENLGEIGFSVGDVEHLIITHPHIDHVGQAKPFIEEGATVYAIGGAGKYLDPAGWEDTFYESFQELGIPESFRDNAAKEILDTFGTSNESLPPEQIDVHLEPGQSFEVGGVEFDTVHTPGHQERHLCFETCIDGERVMFSGDMVIGTFRALTYNESFSPGMYEGIEMYYEGYERLEGRDVDRVYPGHGPVFDDYDEAIHDSLDDLDRRVEETYEALEKEDEGQTSLEVAMTCVHGDMNKVRQNLLDFAGALGYLESQGNAVSEIDDDGMRRFRLDD